MSDLLTTADLENAKKHDTFHSEVITGKEGGLSTGADIDYATNEATGQVQKTLPKTVNDLDWSYVGKFADGVTFTKNTDFAIDANGTQWIYTGGDFPFTAPPSTIPTAPDYQAVHVISHTLLSGRNPGDGTAHNASDISWSEFSTSASSVAKTSINSEGLSKTSHLSARKAVISELDLPYTAWPYGCMFTDVIGGNEYIMQAYTAGSGHVATDKKIFFRRWQYSEDGFFGGFGSRVDMDATATAALTIHACGKLANGDYLGIAREGDPVSATYVYRSTDQGLTWTNEGQFTADTSPVNPREAGQIFVTSAGTVLTAYGSVTGNAFVTRSTDNGVTWSNIGAIDKSAVGGAPLEGSFIQLNNGIIVSVWRANISTDYSSKVRAIYTQSADDGLTWTPFAFTNITDMNNNNAAMIYHDEDDTIEIIYCSRFGLSDGYSSLYQAFSTPADIVNGIFSDPRRLPIGEASRDFGYPSAVKMSNKDVVIGFYNGNDTRTDIQYMIGRRPIFGGIGSMPAMDYRLKNPYTGYEHADYPEPSAGEPRDSVGFNNVKYARSGSALNSSVRIRGDKNYLNGGGVELFNGAPTTGQYIDAKTALTSSGDWNDDIGGLVVKIQIEKSEPLLVTITAGARPFNSTYGDSFADKNASSVIVAETLTVPIDSDGRLYLIVSTAGSLSNIQNVTVTAVGWSSKN